MSRLICGAVIARLLPKIIGLPEKIYECPKSMRNDLLINLGMSCFLTMKEVAAYSI